jgi:hypothetical protein
MELFIGVYLFLAGLGDSPRDLLTLIDADDYFRARQIDTSTENLKRLAGTPAADGKARVAQLLAIRWLGEHREKDAQETLRQLAEGTTAQDPLGFARDYAQRALAQIDGGPAGFPAVPPDSLRKAFQWFPRGVTWFGALDLRGPWAAKPLTLQCLGTPAPHWLFKGDPAGLYQFAEGVGNLRLERIAFAYRSPAPPHRQAYWLVRATGRGDPARIIAALRQSRTPAAARNRQGVNGEPITVLSWKEGPALALIGETDLVLAGHEDHPRALDVLEQVLEVRAGRSPSLSDGRFAADLKALRSDARGALLGELPKDIRKKLADGGGPLSVAPRQFVLYLRGNRDLDLHFHGVMHDAGEAEALIENIATYTGQKIADLKQATRNNSAEILIRTLESIKAQADGNSVSGSTHVSGDVPEALGGLIDGAWQELVSTAVREGVGATLYAGLRWVFRVVIVLFLGLAMVVAVLIVRR